MVRVGKSGRPAAVLGQVVGANRGWCPEVPIGPHNSGVRPSRMGPCDSVVGRSYGLTGALLARLCLCWLLLQGFFDLSTGIRSTTSYIACEDTSWSSTMRPKTALGRTGTDNDDAYE